MRLIYWKFCTHNHRTITYTALTGNSSTSWWRQRFDEYPVSLITANMTERCSKILSVMKNVMQGIWTKNRNRETVIKYASGHHGWRLYWITDIHISKFTGSQFLHWHWQWHWRINIKAAHHGPTWCRPLTMVQHGAVGIVDWMAGGAWYSNTTTSK